MAKRIKKSCSHPDDSIRFFDGEVFCISCSTVVRGKLAEIITEYVAIKRPPESWSVSTAADV